MKKIMLLAVSTAFLMMAGLQSAGAYIIVGQGKVPGGVSQAVYDGALAQAQSQLSKFYSMKDLTEGFATASGYSAHAVTQRGYIGYDRFAITLGAMVGMQVPSTSLSYYKNIKTELQQHGDISAGVGVNAPAVQFGWRSTEDIYLGIRFGYISYRYGDWQFKTLSIGLPVTYQLISPIRIPSGVILWRGLAIGSGLLFQSNVIKYDYTQENPVSSGGITIDPAFRITASSYSFVVPLEVTTAIRLLWVLNVTLGAGVDISLGHSELRLRNIGYAYETANPINNPGWIVIRGYEERELRDFYPKLMAGIGFTFGPVIIDVPVSYYFADKGLNAGVSVGFVW
jgi:hypothetical protein